MTPMDAVPACPQKPLDKSKPLWLACNMFTNIIMDIQGTLPLRRLFRRPGALASCPRPKEPSNQIKATQTVLKPASILSNPLIINNIRVNSRPFAVKTHQSKSQKLKPSMKPLLNPYQLTYDYQNSRQISCACGSLPSNRIKPYQLPIVNSPLCHEVIPPHF